MVKLFWVGDDEENTYVPVSQWERFTSDESTFDGEEEYQEKKQEEIGQLALDVLENHQSIYILAPIAGVELGDIDITVHDTTLTLAGTRNKPKEFYEHAMQVKNEECYWWRFLRNVILPENMDFSQVRAVMEHNLLVIHIPKIRFDSQNIKINRIQS